MNVFLLIFFIVLCWTVNPFFKKIPLQKLSALEFYCIEYFCALIPIIIILIYLYNQNKFSFIQKLDKNDIKYFGLIVFTGVIGGLLFGQLIKYENVSYAIPSIQPLVILCTLIVGYFIFKEKIDIYQIFGIILIIIGLLFINKKKIFN